MQGIGTRGDILAQDLELTLQPTQLHVGSRDACSQRHLGNLSAPLRWHSPRRSGPARAARLPPKMSMLQQAAHADPGSVIMRAGGGGVTATRSIGGHVYLRIQFARATVMSACAWRVRSTAAFRS